MKGSFARIVQFGLSAMLAWGVSQAAPFGEQLGPKTFGVHPDTTHQTMIGFGAGFNETAEALIETIASQADRGKAYDLLYGEPGARLNIVRLVVSPLAQPIAGVPGAPRYDWAHEAGTQSEWTAIQPIFKRTRPILYAVPFTPPARWKMNSKSTDGLSGGSLNPKYYQAYAEYLADFLTYYHSVLGVDIAVLSLQNEPGVPAPWHSCVWNGEQLRDFLKVLVPVVRARGLNTKFMLSEGTNWSGAMLHLIPTLADSQARGLLGAMASHSYNGPNELEARRDFAKASARNGLPVWMSEMSLMQPPQPDDPGMTAALAIADYIHRDVTDAHASAWIYCFAIFRSAFPGSMHPFVNSEFGTNAEYPAGLCPNAERAFEVHFAAGRERAEREATEALVRSAESGKAFLLVLGASGSGKSSLVKAGVLPNLTAPGVVGGVEVWRRVIFRPGQAAADPCGGLETAIAGETTALPELAAAGVTVEALRAQFREAPARAGVLIGVGLARIAPPGAARDVDQADVLPRPRGPVLDGGGLYRGDRARPVRGIRRDGDRGPVARRRTCHIR